MQPGRRALVTTGTRATFPLYDAPFLDCRFLLFCIGESAWRLG